MDIPQEVDSAEPFVNSVFDIEEGDFLSQWILDKYPLIKNVKPLKQKNKHFKMLKYRTDEYTVIVYKNRKKKCDVE